MVHTGEGEVETWGRPWGEDGDCIEGISERERKTVMRR